MSTTVAVSSAQSTQQNATRELAHQTKEIASATAKSHNEQKIMRITTFTISRELQRELITLAAYNTITGKTGKSISQLIRLAIDYYLAAINYTPDIINLNEHNTQYLDTVAGLLRDNKADSGKVTVSVELTKVAYESITTLAGYNKLLGIQPKAASAIARNAISLYIESCDQTYKKFV